MEECMHYCQKLSIDTRGALIETQEQLKEWQAFVREDGHSGSYWMPKMWDGEHWTDYFTGEIDDSLYGGAGKIL